MIKTSEDEIDNALGKGALIFAAIIMIAIYFAI